MERRDLIDTIVLILIICSLAIWNGALNVKNDLKQNKINELEQQINNDLSQSRINELEQQVEEQYYLIDSLKQEV